MASGKEEQEIHALPRQWQAMAQGLHNSGVIVKVDLRQERWYPFEALQAAARETQRGEIAALSLEALDASAYLLQ